MDPPSQGPPYSNVRQHLFHSSHLPPPSQLHLPPVSSSRSNINTLPPLNPSSRMSPYSHRHPSPPPPSSSSASIPWPSTLHRTSSSRDDILPSSSSSSSSPLHQQQHPQGIPHHQNASRQPDQARQLKREQLPPPPPPPAPPAPPPQPPQKDADDNMPATSDFVKKLYKMLEDQSFAHVVSWGPNGDCFVVKVTLSLILFCITVYVFTIAYVISSSTGYTDMNEFTKSILPRMFKHSNFASFVRQLNKYDFHKVKNTDDTQFGEHSWTFKHPDFHADRREALENIKRKVPAARKVAPTSGPGGSSAGLGRSGSAGSPGPMGAGEFESLQSQTSTLASHTNALQNQTSTLQAQTSTLQSQTSALHAQTAALQSVTTGMQGTVSGFQNAVSGLQQQVASLQTQNDTLRTQLGRAEERMRGLERCYKDVLGEMVQFQRNLAQQDALMQGMVQYFLKAEGAKQKDPLLTALVPGPPTAGIPQALVPPQAQQPPHSPAVAPLSAIGHSMTPNTHPPPSLFALSGPSTAGPATASFASSLQPQPSPFLQPLPPPHSHAPPTTSASSSALFRALGRSQAQAQAQAQAHAQAQAQKQVTGQSQSQPQTQQQPPVQPQGQTQGTGPPVHMIHALPPMQQVQFLPVQEAQRVLGLGEHHPDPVAIARASLVQMNEMSRRAETGELAFGIPAGSVAGADVASGSGAGPSTNGTRTGAGTDVTAGNTPFMLPPDMAWDAQPHTGHEGLQVFTLGHLLPRSAIDDANGNWTFGGDMGGASTDGAGDGASVTASGLNGVGESVDGEGEGFEKEETPGAEEVVQPTPTNLGVNESSASGGTSSASDSGSSGSSSSGVGGRQKLRVRRSTFVPGWAVPPRVLLVDDDAVSRRLSSKFLQVFGCAIDVAVDGVGAVNKMNLEKYDLVLMDIVMPKMDGISATSLIRQFDHVTPIISMTSNSRPSEIMTYYSSGMNDILPKPFTKEGLLDMLEKHLMHLKVIQQMSRVPRSICGAQLSSDNSLNDALVSGSSSSPATSASSAAIVGYAGDNGEIGPPAADEGEQVDPMADGDARLGSLVGGARINPLAGMGLTEERYQAILKDLVSGDGLTGVGVPEGFAFGLMDGNANGGIGVGLGSGLGMGEKRGLDEEGDAMREGKRGRFEVLD
ncbi:hypothetical protein ID866_7528 [Astraeus odoratus]|nr:hypothetical protein ID866_7528 [Astraeus odoratus]